MAFSSTCNDAHNSVYGSVYTWGDLLRTNVDFLEGKLRSTFYYCNKFHDSCYTNGVNRIEGDLLRLHRHHGIFTHDGQNNEYTKPNTWQRGYLSFVCENDPALVQRLIDDPCIYTFARMEHEDGTCDILHNCPNRVVLTSPVGANFVTMYWEEDNELLELCHDLPHVERLLQNATHVTIMLREYPTMKNHRLPEATQCLLDALNDREYD